VPAIADQGAWTTFDATSGLSSQDIYSIAASGGRVWAGMDGAVATFNAENSTWRTLNPPGLLSRVTCVAIGDNDVWFGTFGSGIFRYKEGTWSSYARKDGLPDDRVQDLTISGGYLYVATAAGASRISIDKTPPLFTNLRSTDGLPEQALTSVAVTKDMVWFGTKAHGVLGVDLATFRYSKQVSKPDGLSDSRVLCLGADEGYLWIGTGAGGLCRYDLADGSISIYNKSTGLADNLVSALAVDNVVWCGSWSAGATLLDSTGGTTVYDSSSGLADNDVRDLAADSGAVWFATEKGISRFTGKVSGGGGRGLPLLYIAIAGIIVAAVAIPMVMHGRSQGEKGPQVSRRKRPFELCGGQPSEDFCPFCRYNVIRSGKHFCSKYRVPIPFEDKA